MTRIRQWLTAETERLTRCATNMDFFPDFIPPEERKRLDARIYAYYRHFIADIKDWERGEIGERTLESASSTCFHWVRMQLLCLRKDWQTWLEKYNPTVDAPAVARATGKIGEAAAWYLFSALGFLREFSEIVDARPEDVVSERNKILLTVLECSIDWQASFWDWAFGQDELMPLSADPPWSKPASEVTRQLTDAQILVFQVFRALQLTGRPATHPSSMTMTFESVPRLLLDAELYGANLTKDHIDQALRNLVLLGLLKEAFPPALRNCRFRRPNGEEIGISCRSQDDWHELTVELGGTKFRACVYDTKHLTRHRKLECYALTGTGAGSDLEIDRKDQALVAASPRGQGLSFTLDTIPPLDKTSGMWVSQKEAAELTERVVHTLANHRDKGERSDDMTCGIDSKGRVWRKEESNSQDVWYLRSIIHRG